MWWTVGQTSDSPQNVEQRKQFWVEQMSGSTPSQRVPGRGWAHAAAAVAVFSAVVSLYWSFGGTIGIRSVGGQIADLARSATAPATVLALAAALLKLLGVAFALVLAGRLGRRLRPRWVVTAGRIAAAVLTIYGAANMVGAALVLTGVVRAPGADRYALAWHLGLWDLLFLLWGVCLAVAVSRYRRTVTLSR